MKTFVVDSSVSLKWVLNDEINSIQALYLQKRYLAGEINLIAPNLWLYEIINGLKNISLKRPNIGHSILDLKLTKLIESSPNLMDISDLSHLCLKRSLDLNISAYDSTYITLAYVNGFTLITADTKLVNKVNDPKLVISLKDVTIN